VILIVIIGKECVVLEVSKLTALLMLVVNHGRWTAYVAPALLHLLLEAPLMLYLFIVEVVIAVVAALVIIFLFIILTVVDLLHILIFLICIIILHVPTCYHILVVMRLVMQQFHILFKIGFTFGHSIVRVLDWRTLLDHLILSGLLLLSGRGFFRGGRDIDGEAVKVEWRHLVRSRFDVNLEQIEPGVARLTVKSNVALTFHVLVLLRWVVVAQVPTGGIAHTAPFG
jgi:hypothetical protein